MSIQDCLQPLYSIFITLISRFWPPSSTAAAAPVVDAEHNHVDLWVQWRNRVMVFCFTSALEIASLFAQAKSQLPLPFHLLSFSIFLTFQSLFLANFIGPSFRNAAQVLEKTGVLIAATAVVLTITIPLPLSLKCVCWALYAISLFTVLICKYCCF